MSFIHADNLVKEYGKGNNAFMAVRGISFEVERGEFVAVTGKSGSGKSTLLTIMGALNTPSRGTYMVDEVNVYALGQDKRAEFRREYLGFVFQSFHLISYLTVIENVMLPLTIVHQRPQEKRAMAAKALARMGLSGKESRLPAEISGGEQERVAIARAVVNQPRILLADEPTGSVDTRTSLVVMDLFRELNREGMTIIMVTHNPECARFAGRTVRLSDGMLDQGMRGEEGLQGLCR